MAVDLPAETLIRLAILDFEAAWSSVSATKDIARSNFMFAKQAMVVLELAARACASDATGAALEDFGRELASREPRYFTALPGRVWAPSTRTQKSFRLPTRGGQDAEGHLLAAMFNLIRNGQAHQYQQMRAILLDRTEFCVQVTGADRGLAPAPSGSAARSDHLLHWLDGADLWLKLRTDVFFVDVRDAVRAASLESRGLSLIHLVEDRSNTFNFTHAALKSVLDGM